MPVPQYTPIRLRSADASSRPLALIACAAAPSANCETRSIFAASPGVNMGAGSQSTRAPTCTPEPCAISAGRRRTPERASARDRWNSASELPSGETTPAPVIATRRPLIADRLGLARGGEGGGDGPLEVGEGLDALQVLVRHADAEFRLDLGH